MNKKILLGSIIAVGMVLLPLAIAVPELESDNIDEIKPQNIRISGKPDLTVEKIFDMSNNIIVLSDIKCRIKNIGDTITPGDRIEIFFEMKKMLFGVIPIETVYSSTWETICSGIEPGESRDFTLLNAIEPDEYLGFYKVTCKVNPNWKFAEESYFNNRRTDRFFTFYNIYIGI